MRIAYIVNSFPGISETFIVNQIAGIAARGHLVHVYTTAKGPTAPGGVEGRHSVQHIYRLHGSSSYLARAAKTLGLLLAYGWRAPNVVLQVFNMVRRRGPAGSLRLLHAALTFVRLRERQYDVIHAQFGTLGLLALNLVEVGAVSGAIITSFRGYDMAKHVKDDAARYQALFGKGVLFLPVSHSLAARLRQVGCDPGKIRVHRSGIECRRLSYAERVRPERGDTRIVTVGRLVEKKGISYGIEAVARVIASGRPVHYSIVGDGPLRDSLERLIEKLRLTRYVTLAGWKAHDEVLDLIRAAHILVAPSVTAADGDAEGIPNALKEAMAIGVPVISTVHGGIPELVEDGVSGFLVREHDAEALAERISYLVTHPESWAAMGQAARTRVEAEYDIDKLNDELVNLYRAVAPQSGATPKLFPNGRLVGGSFRTVARAETLTDASQDMRLS